MGKTHEPLKLDQSPHDTISKAPTDSAGSFASHCVLVDENVNLHTPDNLHRPTKHFDFLCVLPLVCQCSLCVARASVFLLSLRSGAVVTFSGQSRGLAPAFFACHTDKIKEASQIEPEEFRVHQAPLLRGPHRLAGLVPAWPLEPCHGRPRPRHRRMGSITRHRPFFDTVPRTVRSPHGDLLPVRTHVRVLRAGEGDTLQACNWQFAAKAGLVCTFSLFRWFSTHQRHFKMFACLRSHKEARTAWGPSGLSTSDWGGALPPRGRTRPRSASGGVASCSGSTPETWAAPGTCGLLSSCGRSSASGRFDTGESFGTGLSCLQEHVMSTPARQACGVCDRPTCTFFVPSRQCWSVLPPRQHSGTHPEGSVIPKSHPSLVFSRLATSVFHCPVPAWYERRTNCDHVVPVLLRSRPCSETRQQ